MAEAENITQRPATEVKPRRPWEVFIPAKRGHPPNPLRYSSTLWLAAGMVLIATFVTWIVFPTRGVNADMHTVVAGAEADGVPQIPPPYATEEEMEKFFAKWQISCAETINGAPACDYVRDLADKHGAYRDDISILFLGVVAGLVAVLFVAAVAFARALNNLYALGHEASEVPQAWAFVSFFIPILNLVLPWLLVDQIWRAAWSRGDGTGSSRPSVVAGLWGLMVIAVTVLNPVTMSWFVRRNDIHSWLTHLEWVNRSLIWVIVPVIFTTLLLVAVTWRQHRRFRQLDAAARAQRVSA